MGQQRKSQSKSKPTTTSKNTNKIWGDQVAISPRLIRTTTDLVEVQNRLAEMGRALMTIKNRDYGDHQNNDPFANFRRHGLMGILVRMDDKLARLSTFAKTGKLSVTDESFIDACIDLMNYAAIAVAFEMDRIAGNSNRPDMRVIVSGDDNCTVSL